MRHRHLVGRTVPDADIVNSVPVFIGSRFSRLRLSGINRGDSLFVKKRRVGYYPRVCSRHIGQSACHALIAAADIVHPFVIFLVISYVLGAHLDEKFSLFLIALGIKLAVGIDIRPPAYVP